MAYEIWTFSEIKYISDIQNLKVNCHWKHYIWIYNMNNFFKILHLIFCNAYLELVYCVYIFRLFFTTWCSGWMIKALVCGQESGGCDFFLCYMLKSWDVINNIIIIKNKKGWKIECKFVDNPT